MSTFDKLWSNHPTGEYPCSTDGKENFDNQCAIRMGECFEKSGISTKSWSVRRCWQHKGALGHILAAEEMANSLTRTVIPGMKKVEKYSGKEGFDKIKNRRGIVFFGNFYGTGMQGDHIDLWNGRRLSSFKSLISIYTPWGSRYEKGAIWFWETA
jgi:hypothetical protein